MKMTIKQYANVRGVTTQGIIRAIKNGWNAPGIKAATQAESGDWSLDVDITKLDKNVNIANRKVTFKDGTTL